MEETPLITPSRFLSLEGIARADNPCTAAVIAFCPFHGMKDLAHARPLEKPLFVHVDRSHQFQGIVEGRRVLMVECVYGGPVCATVIEEMAHLGVKHVIGYGYSGSLREAIVPGTIVLASSGTVSDGASREYLDAPEVEGSAALMAAFDTLDGSLRAGVRTGRAWTTDAIYREYPSKIQSWIQAGADFVNMDTSHFYAVSQAVGIEALYFSLISDYVGGETWDQQFRDLQKPRERLQKIILELIPLIPVRADERQEVS